MNTYCFTSQHIALYTAATIISLSELLTWIPAPARTTHHVVIVCVFVVYGWRDSQFAASGLNGSSWNYEPFGIMEPDNSELYYQPFVVMGQQVVFQKTNMIFPVDVSSDHLMISDVSVIFTSAEYCDRQIPPKCKLYHE